MSGPDAPSVTQADRDLAEQICGCATAEQRRSDAKAIALHREQAEAASKARLLASMEMVEDYHAAHVEQRSRAQKAEGELAASKAREAALVELLSDCALLIEAHGKERGISRKIVMRPDGETWASSVDVLRKIAILAKHKDAQP